MSREKESVPDLPMDHGDDRAATTELTELSSASQEDPLLQRERGSELESLFSFSSSVVNITHEIEASSTVEAEYCQEDSTTYGVSNLEDHGDITNDDDQDDHNHDTGNEAEPWRDGDETLQLSDIKVKVEIDEDFDCSVDDDKHLDLDPELELTDVKVEINEDYNHHEDDNVADEDEGPSLRLRDPSLLIDDLSDNEDMDDDEFAIHPAYDCKGCDASFSTVNQLDEHCRALRWNMEHCEKIEKAGYGLNSTDPNSKIKRTRPLPDDPRNDRDRVAMGFVGLVKNQGKVKNLGKKQRSQTSKRTLELNLDPHSKIRATQALPQKEKEEDKPVPCPICNVIFPNQFQLSFHKVKLNHFTVPESRTRKTRNLRKKEAIISQAALNITRRVSEKKNEYPSAYSASTEAEWVNRDHRNVLWSTRWKSFKPIFMPVKSNNNNGDEDPLVVMENMKISALTRRNVKLVSRFNTPKNTSKIRLNGTELVTIEDSNTRPQRCMYITRRSRRSKARKTNLL